MDSKQIFTVFGAVLREARKAKGLSQERLAFDTGFDRTFISRLERGLTQPSLESILRLSKALDMTLTSLVGCFEQEYCKLELGL